MVRNLGALFGSWLCGANVHVPVNLPAVGIDNFATELVSEGYRELSLARGCGADYVEDRGVYRKHLPAVEIPLLQLPRAFASPARRAISMKESAWRLAPPTSAPWMLDCPA